MCKSDVTVARVVGEMHEGDIVGTSGTCAVGMRTWCGGGAVVACGVREMHKGDVVGAVGVCAIGDVCRDGAGERVAHACMGVCVACAASC